MTMATWTTTTTITSSTTTTMTTTTTTTKTMTTTRQEQKRMVQQTLLHLIKYCNDTHYMGGWVVVVVVEGNYTVFIAGRLKTEKQGQAIKARPSGHSSRTADAPIGGH